ncbi:unnamed protein product (macronuclear) [Paramecium tetraurelia]|uniref:RRM domain-containing protein n=1 Tax=Paramecium tetraurelia TaxID=5888 RepID=A0BK05_PARTE|nr:uncharacterized protein GSPATT00029502001 [Paramecium tetraurelia]CAK58872.1 unnamed protein product [Paramecium tetraurelia]|eukprot:XP_001426270.1 hypothetical protein (macronuclear) [Paramecium tetraurelia strain d4-2]
MLPHSLFYRYFSNFGEVDKILIFEKGKLWKCFVEMATLQQARFSQQQLNGCQLYDQTIMNVYYSTLQNVTFLNNNSGGVDYKSIRQGNSTKTTNNYEHDYHSKTFSQPTIFQHQQDIKQSFVGIWNEGTRASLNDKYELQEQKNEWEPSRILTSLEFIDDGDSPRYNQFSSYKSIQCDDNEHDPIDEDIMLAFSSEKNIYLNSYMFSIPEVEDKTKNQDIDPYTYVSPQFLRENQPSKVVYIRGLINQNITPLNIFNLLSNFGNVLAIIQIKHKASALVQFQKLSHAQNALDHLNNQVFFGSKLKIFYSNYQEIQLPLPIQSPQTVVFVPQKSQFRFSESKSISINPPSQTLHLSNIKGKICEEESYIKELFKGIGNVQAIKFIHIDKQKHMALVRLSSLEEALNGAALLHGKEVMGRKINVSFTKSKLC